MSGTSESKHSWYLANKALCYLRFHCYGRTLKGKLNRMWLSANQRVLGQDRDRAHIYKGKNICKVHEMYDKFLNSKQYFDLFQYWASTGFQLKASPSIDRINGAKGYEIENVQILTQSQNRRKERC